MLIPDGRLNDRLDLGPNDPDLGADSLDRDADALYPGAGVRISARMAQGESGIVWSLLRGIQSSIRRIWSPAGKGWDLVR